jgi:hypothetical protein
MADRRFLVAVPIHRSGLPTAGWFARSARFFYCDASPLAFLACDRIIDVAKMFAPNKPIWPVLFGEAIDFSASMLTQTSRDVIRNPNVQHAATLVGENVHPIVVIAHRVELIRDVSLRST